MGVQGARFRGATAALPRLRRLCDGCDAARQRPHIGWTAAGRAPDSCSTAVRQLRGGGTAGAQHRIGLCSAWARQPLLPHIGDTMALEPLVLAVPRVGACGGHP